MDFQKLKTFRVVATLLNFNRAAEVLHYAQSSISAQIKSLEEDLGCQLFERTGRQILLTDAGEKMLKYTDRILSIRDEALADVAGFGKAEGTITIRAPQTIATSYLPKILKTFQVSFPKVRLDVGSCAYHSLEKELRTGIVDIAFLFADSIQSSSMVVDLLAVEKLVIAAAPNHHLALKKKINYKDLENVPVFLPKKDCGYRMTFEQAMTSQRIDSIVIMDFNCIAAIKECVKIGSGITLIPETAIQKELASGELIPLQWETEMEVGTLLIRNKERRMSAILTAFIEITKQVMANKVPA